MSYAKIRKNWTESARFSIQNSFNRSRRSYWKLSLMNAAKQTHRKKRWKECHEIMTGTPYFNYDAIAFNVLCNGRRHSTQTINGWKQNINHCKLNLHIFPVWSLSLASSARVTLATAAVLVIIVVVDFTDVLSTAYVFLIIFLLLLLQLWCARRLLSKNLYQTLVQKWLRFYWLKVKFVRQYINIRTHTHIIIRRIYI